MCTRWFQKLQPYRHRELLCWEKWVSAARTTTETPIYVSYDSKPKPGNSAFKSVKWFPCHVWSWILADSMAEKVMKGCSIECSILAALLIHLMQCIGHMYVSATNQNVHTWYLRSIGGKGVETNAIFLRFPFPRMHSFWVFTGIGWERHGGSVLWSIDSTKTAPGTTLGYIEGR